MLKLFIICAFCSLFCNLFSSAVFAALMTVFIDFAAEYAYYPLTMMKHIETAVPQTFSRFLYHLLPNFDKLDLKYQSAHGSLPEWGYIFTSSTYALLYIVVIFLISWKVFTRHEH
jgi:ABC-type transport system involved in multi-copper enzyme maturation permease subunit